MKLRMSRILPWRAFREAEEAPSKAQAATSKIIKRLQKNISTKKGKNNRRKKDNHQNESNKQKSK